MKRTLFIFVALWLCGQLFAFAEPGLPRQFLGTYGEWSNGDCKPNKDEKWVCKPPKRFSGIVVAPAKGKFRVWLLQWGTSSECEFDGIGTWNGRELVASREVDPAAGVCELAVKFESDKVTTIARSPACTWGCGSWIEVKNVPKLSLKTAIPPRQ